MASEADLVHFTESESANGATVFRSRPVWTKGHEPEPCLGCGALTETRSPDGKAWCFPVWRRGRIEKTCRTIERWMATRGKTGGAKALAGLFGAAAPRANPDPVGAAREREAFADHEGIDTWEAGRE